MEPQENFQLALAEQGAHLTDPLKIASWEHFSQLGLPTKKWEAFRYVKLKEVYATAPERAAPEALEREIPEQTILFVDGTYQRHSCSAEGLEILPLTEAHKTYGSFLKKRQKQALKNERDPFTALNAALFLEGVFLYLSPGAKLEKPITLLHVTCGSSALVMPRIQIFAGSGAQATLKMCTETQGALNGALDIHLEKKARVKVTYETKGTPSWHFESLRAALKENATLEAVHVTKGSAATRYDYCVDLLEEGAEVSLSGLAMLKGKSEAHANVLITHHAPGCTSNQLFKNCVDETGHASFEGKIYVHPEAQQTEAYQLNANLLLSEGARAEAKPNLEIFADDVRASHGATFGSLEEEEVFYLKTRGLTQEQAEKSLIQGFAQEILDKIE